MKPSLPAFSRLLLVALLLPDKSEMWPGPGGQGPSERSFLGWESRLARETLSPGRALPRGVFRQEALGEVCNDTEYSGGSFPGELSNALSYPCSLPLL